MNKSKYNVAGDKSKRTYDGIVFDSAVEMKYYRDVVVPQIKDGIIAECVRQKKYILQPAYTHNGKKILPIDYKADFYLKFTDGNELVIDIKGCPDAVAKIKRKMFHYVYPDIDYRWVGYSPVDGGFVTYETIMKGRKARKKLKGQIKENKDDKQRNH